MSIFKQIFSGLIYALMTMSFILSPIPNVGVEWAYGEESEVYRADGDLDGIIQKAQLNKYTGHQSSFAAIMEQAVAGMMAVVLLQSLRYRYLHEENPALYGNDCPSNKAADYTIRIAQLGALSYLVGDIKANMEFQKASKKAMDGAFGAQASPSEASGEKNQQLRSFDTLAEVFDGQEKGLKAKMALSTLSEAAYLSSLGLELAGIVQCNAACASNMAAYEAKLAIFQASMAAATAAVASDPANYPSTACASAVSAPLTALKAQASAIQAANTAADQAKSKAKWLARTEETTFWTSAFAEVKSFFSVSTVTKAADAASGAAEAVVDQISSGAKSIAKFIGLPVEEKDDAVKVAESTATQSLIAQKVSGDLAVVSPTAAGGQACTSARIAVSAAINAYVDLSYSPVACCGGPGLNTAEQASLLSARESLIALSSSLFGTAHAEERSRTLTATGIALAKQDIAKKMGEEAVAQAAKTLGVSEAEMLNNLLAGGRSTDENGDKFAFAQGTLPGTGLPIPGQFSDAKDIRVLDVLEGLLDGSESSSIDAQERTEDIRYFVKNNFESVLRRLAMISQLESLNAKNPKQELEKIAKLEQKINQTMFFINQLVDETVNPKSMETLAFQDFKQHRTWPSIVGMISSLIVPEAHASFLGSVGKGLVVSAGLQLLQKQVGTSGPWDEILNIGTQFMLVGSVLGKFAKSYGFVKPKGRAYTWGAMSAINLLVLSLDKKAKDKVSDYKKKVIESKEKYKEAVGLGGVADTDGEKRDGSGLLKLKEGASAPQYAVGGAPVKTCAVAKGQGFAPAPCPSSIPSSKFKIANVDKKLVNGVTPSHIKSIGLVSSYSRGLATGSKGVDDLASMDLNSVQKVNAAMRAKNEELLKKVDSMDKKAGKKYKKQASPQTLASLIAKAKKGIASEASTQALASFNPNTLPSSKGSDKDEKKKEGTYQANTPSYGIPKIGGGEVDYDSGFSFGDEGEEELAGASSGAEQKLDDYVLEHDDINKRKDVSIFKILSHRYLQSYPKVLEKE